MARWKKNLGSSHGYPRSCQNDQEHAKEQEENFK